jgi:hypothetical protein
MYKAVPRINGVSVFVFLGFSKIHATGEGYSIKCSLLNVDRGNTTVFLTKKQGKRRRSRGPPP